MLMGMPWVNDLDLEVVIGGATVYRGNNFLGSESYPGGEPDRRNNVESVFIPAGAIPEGISGNFTVKVRAMNIAGDGVPGDENLTDQDFALVIYNIGPAFEPPPAPVILSASYLKKTLTISGRDFSSAARVEVNGKLVARALTYDPATNSLIVAAKPKKLNLVRGSDNHLVVIENDRRSVPYILSL
jgi:hypothetical protein